MFEQLGHAMRAAYVAGIIGISSRRTCSSRGLAGRSAFTLKVLDFGIAKLVAGEGLSTAAIGSPMWLAPEQTERSGHGGDGRVGDRAPRGTAVGKSYWRAAIATPSVANLLREILVDDLDGDDAREARARAPAGLRRMVRAMRRARAARCNAGKRAPSS